MAIKQIRFIKEKRIGESSFLSKFKEKRITKKYSQNKSPKFTFFKQGYKANYCNTFLYKYSTKKKHNKSDYKLLLIKDFDYKFWLQTLSLQHYKITLYLIIMKYQNLHFIN